MGVFSAGQQVTNICCIIICFLSLSVRESIALDLSRDGILDLPANTGRGVDFGLLDDGGPGLAAAAIQLSNHELGKQSMTRALGSSPLSHIKASVLTVTLLVFICTKKIDSSWFWIALVLYLLEASCCSTRRFLSNSYTPRQLENYMQTLKEAPLEIIWMVECWHYQHLHNRESRKNVMHKVVTHRGSQKFIHESLKDSTDTASVAKSLSVGSSTYVKTTLSKLVLFANDQSLESYRAQESRFRNIYRTYDHHVHFSTHLVIDGFRHKILAVRTGLSDVPMAKTLWFWVFSLLGMTVPFRIWFATHCEEVKVTVTKELSV